MDSQGSRQRKRDDALDSIRRQHHMQMDPADASMIERLLSADMADSGKLGKGSQTLLHSDFYRKFDDDFDETDLK